MTAAPGATKLDAESGPTRSRVHTRTSCATTSFAAVLSSPDTFGSPSTDNASTASAAGRERPCETGVSASV